MKTNLFEVIQALNNRFNLELELPNRNFDLTKSIVIEDAYTDSSKIHNCIVYIRNGLPRITSDSFKDCLVISTYALEIFYNFFSICSNHPLQLFDFLVSSNYADEPYGIDEMSMVRWENSKNTVERTILGYSINDLKSSFIIGPGARIGISGDQFYYDENHIPRQVSSIGGVKIGKNVIIGANVLIYRGHTNLTEIDDNTVIGANSIIYGGFKVKGYIKPNTIYK